MGLQNNASALLAGLRVPSLSCEGFACSRFSRPFAATSGQTQVYKAHTVQSEIQSFRQRVGPSTVLVYVVLHICQSLDSSQQQQQHRTRAPRASFCASSCSLIEASEHFAEAEGQICRCAACDHKPAGTRVPCLHQFRCPEPAHAVRCFRCRQQVVK